MNHICFCVIKHSPDRRSLRRGRQHNLQNSRQGFHWSSLPGPASTVASPSGTWLPAATKT